MSTRLSLDDMISDIAACLSFYTRLPVGWAAERSFAAAQWAAPIAGILVGGVVALVLWICMALGIPATLGAAMALASGLALTGALHEDGLADTLDGFGGGATPERKLEIMRDSRIGTYGSLALMSSLFVRWSALVILAGVGGGTMLLAIIAAHTMSRALIPAFMSRLPPARPDGLSAGVGRIQGGILMAALAIGAFIGLLSGPTFLALAVALLAGLFFLIENYTIRQIGGHTGDVIGALQQSAEIVVFILAASLLT